MPKVLLITHNPLSSYTNMGKTLQGLVGAFDKDELCQLYIYPSLPDKDTCASFYRITDKAVLRGVLTGRVQGGEVQPVDVSAMFEKAGDEKVYRNPKNKTAVRMLLRDLLWKMARWNNKGLKTWLQEQRPDAIFVAPGTAKFLYDIALWTARYLHIPIVTYVCDDYYFSRRAGGLLRHIEGYLLRRKITQLMKRTTCLVAISPSLERAYSREFGCPAVTVMTAAATISAHPQVPAKPTSVTYMGNIRSNRYLSLAEFGRALDVFNEKYGLAITLDIYTAEKDADILSAFDGIDAVCLKGFVAGEAYQEAFEQTEYLLFAESFQKESRALVKHSVSTKIAESLGSGKCLLAYGPPELASMQHLTENECALVATAAEQLPALLETAFLHPEQTEQVIENALKTARTYHDATAVTQAVRAVFEALSPEEVSV